MRQFHGVSFTVLVLLLAGFLPGFGFSFIHSAPVSAGIGPGPGCSVSAGNLITNGGFEQPATSREYTPLTPDGWMGGVGIYRNGQAPQGAQYAYINGGSVAQFISTAGLEGATLTLTLQYRGSNPLVAFGDTTTQLPSRSTFGIGGVTYDVPASNPPPTVTVLFYGTIDLDDVMIDASCPVPYRAVDDSYAVTEDTPLVVPANVGLLANDSIPANQTVSIDLIADTPGEDYPGVFSNFGPGGSFTFTPNANATGVYHPIYTASSSSGDVSSATITITITAVNDAPVLANIPATVTLEATGLNGVRLPADTTLPTATDADSTAAGNATTVTCTAVLPSFNGPPSTQPVTPGATFFPLGTTTVTCIATDIVALGTAAAEPVTATFDVVVQDTTAPTLTVPANITVEATSSAGTVVPYTATATDVVDGPVTPVCTPAPGSTFPIGKTTVTCTATDAAGNVATGSFTVTVGDSTGPVITWIGGPQPGKTYTQGTLPAEPTCTATDTSSPVVQCRVYGYSTAPGTHTLTARARDAEGNASVSTRTYTVTASAPTATPRPATATPRPATATPRPATATPPPTTATPVAAQPTAIPTRAPRPTATPVTPSVPTAAPTRAPRR